MAPQPQPLDLSPLNLSPLNLSPLDRPFNLRPLDLSLMRRDAPMATKSAGYGKETQKDGHCLVLKAPRKAGQTLRQMASYQAIWRPERGRARRPRRRRHGVYRRLAGHFQRTPRGCHA